MSAAADYNRTPRREDLANAHDTGETHRNSHRKAAPIAADGVETLRRLLDLELQIRAAESIAELACLCVNEFGSVIPSRQIFFAEAEGLNATLRQVSGSPTIDANAPTVRWIQRSLNMGLQGAISEAKLIDIQPDSQSGRAFNHPFPFGLWCPLVLRNGNVVGGFFALQENAWCREDVSLARRLTETASHAAATLRVAPKSHWPKRRKHQLTLAAIAAVVILVWPVPMSALAPTEITASDPFVIAAPTEGIIESVTVNQNSPVRKGDVLARYVDTVQRNALEVSEQEVAVARAKLQQALQGSFEDERFKRDIGQARAELATKVAERDFAQETFERTVVRAPHSGIAAMDDPKEWAGKPVAVGTRIMEIVDPARVEARIDLAVADGFVASNGARVKLFLDSDPSRAFEATVVTSSSFARMTEAGALSYRLVAKLALEGVTPRLGSRGTAQIYAEVRPFGFYLFRRPLSWLRQKFGL